MPRAKFLRQLECAHDIKAARNPGENTLLLSQATSHVAGFTLIDATCLVVGGGIQQRRNKPEPNTLYMMVSGFACGDERRRCRSKSRT
jgi:hypothetical protein